MMNWFRPWLAHGPNGSSAKRQPKMDPKTSLGVNESSLDDSATNDDSDSGSGSSNTVAAVAEAAKEIDNLLKSTATTLTNKMDHENDLKSKYYSFYYNYYYNQLLMQNYCSVMIGGGGGDNLKLSLSDTNQIIEDDDKSMQTLPSQHYHHRSKGLSQHRFHSMHHHRSKSMESTFACVESIKNNNHDDDLSNNAKSENENSNVFKSFLVKSETYCSGKSSKSLEQQQLQLQRPKKFVCVECQNGFSNRSQLNSHIRTHTGERPFVCDYKNCHKSFTRNEELTRHRRIHSGIRPYQCRWCDKCFGRKDHLRKHERTHERRLRSALFLNYTNHHSNPESNHQIGGRNNTDLVAKLQEDVHQSILHLTNEINNHHHHHQYHPHSSTNNSCASTTIIK